MGGENITAFMLLVVAIGKEHDVARNIRGLNYVEEVHIVYGEYDVVVKIVADTLKNLDKVVTKIRGFDGVIRSVTLISSEE